MTRRRVQVAGWGLIAAVTAFSFVLDHYRMLLWHFNWFMAILMVLSIGLVGAIVRLAWIASEPKASTRRQSGQDEKEPI